MTSSRVDLARREIWERSLERSRARRAAAAAARRRRLRTRGGAGSLVAVTLLTCVLGAGLAVGQAQRPVAQASAVVLKMGSAGPAVAALQRKLGVAADGIFGPITRRAVRRFQRRAGLLVDGIAGPQTLAALGLRLSARVRQRGTSRQGAGVPAVLERIAQCESGGNPRAVSGDGRYRGKYQFDRATWRSLGGRGDPAAAPEAVQDRLALKLYRLRGTAPWANCA